MYTPSFTLNKCYDKNSKKWCISPNTLENQNKFLIIADTENEASDLVEKLLNKTFDYPHLNESGWEKISQINTTPIYKRIRD